jgi:hypothetical protein
VDDNDESIAPFCRPIDVDKIAVVEFYALPLIGYIPYATQMGYDRL